MSLLLANGAPVISARLQFPRVGVWHAQVDIDADAADDFLGSFELDAGDFGLFVGTTKPKDVDHFAGRVRAKVTGGAGGFGTPCPPKFYRQMDAATVLKDALAVGGEKLAPDSTGIGSQFPFWTRHESSVGEAFEEAVAALDAVWRVLDDGTVWVGTETWPDAEVLDEAEILEENPAERTAILSDAESIRPGTTYGGRHIGRVEIHIEPEQTRTQVWFQDQDSEGDPVRAALTKIVRQMTRTIDFLAMYPAKVVSQNGDGTLELKPTSDRMPGMSRIPIRYGVPGVRAKVKRDSYVALEFEQGSPSRPVATVWDRESVAELTIKADRVVIDALDIEAQKGRPLARVGDMVQVISTPPGTPAIGQIMTGNAKNRG